MCVHNYIPKTRLYLVSLPNWTKFYFYAYSIQFHDSDSVASENRSEFISFISDVSCMFSKVYR